MNMKKTLTAAAVLAGLGMGASTVNAAAIQSFTLGDVDADGLSSDFRFTTTFDSSFPPGNGPNQFGTPTDDCGGGPGSCGAGAFGVPVGTDVFTSGFNFGGGGDFKPNVTGSLEGDITGGVLDLTSWDFGGIYNGLQFFLDADDLGDITGNAADANQPVFPADGAFTGVSSNGVVDYYLDSLTDNGDGTYDFEMRWTSFIDQGSSFDGQIARWRLEGTFDTNASTVVPVPAAAWLFGSGLLGLVGVARRRKKSA